MAARLPTGEAGSHYELLQLIMAARLSFFTKEVRG